MTDRPLGPIDLDQLVQILPDLIADALRQRETRPAPDRRATLTKATGVVTTAGTTTAEVQLDEDEPGVISQVQLASAVRAGDRVVVLLSPGGSAIAIGSGNAQAVASALADPLPTDWIEWFPTGTQTGLAYFGALVGIDWDDSGSSGITHGTAITLNGSANAVVNEDGYYTLDCYVMVGADAIDTLWDEALFQLTVVKSFSIGGDVMDNAIDIVSIPPIAESGQQAYGAMTFAWTGYLEATNTVEVKARMRAGADPGDTWSVFDGSFRMEKLPM